LFNNVTVLTDGIPLQQSVQYGQYVYFKYTFSYNTSTYGVSTDPFDPSDSLKNRSELGLELGLELKLGLELGLFSYILTLILTQH
jgi:hypothetical protein